MASTGLEKVSSDFPVDGSQIARAKWAVDKTWPILFEGNLTNKEREVTILALMSGFSDKKQLTLKQVEDMRQVFLDILLQGNPSL